MTSSEYKNFLAAKIASGETLSGYLRKHGIPQSTYYGWRKRFQSSEPVSTHGPSGFIEATRSDSNPPPQPPASSITLQSHYTSLKIHLRNATLTFHPNTPISAIANSLKAIQEAIPC
jgi:transposase-like protein